jgi:hypothetical protein
MSRNERRRKQENARASSSTANTHRTLVSLPGIARDIERPITTFVDRISNDNRRLYREEVPVLPPSPVKRMKLARHVAASTSELSATTFTPATDHGLDGEHYQISHFNADDEEPFDAPSDAPRTAQPSKPIEPSVSTIP